MLSRRSLLNVRALAACRDKYFTINTKGANVVSGVFQSITALATNLLQDGWTYNEIFHSLLDYMPWTYKGIQKILKDKDYKEGY